MANDKFKVLVQNNLSLFRNELCPYEYKIEAYDSTTNLELIVKSSEENLPHLLGLQEISPSLKGAFGVKKIDEGKVSSGRLHSSVKDTLKISHIFRKNEHFLYLPFILSYAKPLYLYQNKNTNKFDCDYLLVKKISTKRKHILQNGYIHIGMKATGIISNEFILNSILVTFDNEKDYDIYFKGQPFYTIKKVRKVNVLNSNSEITYLERNEINLSIETIAATLSKDNAQITSKLVKNIERISRKLNKAINTEEISNLYNERDNIEDPRLKHLIKETFFLLNT